ncbi:hypothetical protein H2200_002848 [Cladophialophora chaetospira]|uniref:G-patch domain-containing protein n=1 Tax=Cladophialophora chaetospira TaxID=386627 RepID=A0AA39CLR5_9EURO|nr:hypothetical protein H2200_002848 [Cladophialophora chaetospira]
MDAHAHLLSLGWAGSGHSLDSKPYKQKGHRGLAYDPAKVGNNGAGLVKPLSISRRQARFGIGKKAHEPQAGNEWWLKGFESALGNIGKSESERSSGTSTPITREHTGKHGGLYGFFVKGQLMEGTIGEVEETKRPSKKRKSDHLDDTTQVHTPKTTSLPIETPVAEFEQAGAFFALRDKDEKRRRRAKKVDPVEEFRQMGEYLEVQAQKKKKKIRLSEAVESPVDASQENSQPEAAEDVRVETKDQRRARRQRRREEKERERNALVALQNQRQSDSRIDDGTDDAIAKAARRAERKRRKSKGD